MKLDTPVKTLGPVNYMPLKTAVASVKPEAWLEDNMRQKSFEQHAYTQSIILLFADGWPEIKVTQRSGWNYFAEPARNLAGEILGKHYPPNGVVIRAMVAKLLAGGVIAEHFDSHPSFAVAHRIHVPLFTNDMVDFTVRGENFHLTEGIAYEISNLDYHSVNNRSTEDRIHYIFDYVVK